MQPTSSPSIRNCKKSTYTPLLALRQNKDVSPYSLKIAYFRFLTKGGRCCSKRRTGVLPRDWPHSDEVLDTYKAFCLRGCTFRPTIVFLPQGAGFSATVRN